MSGDVCEQGEPRAEIKTNPHTYTHSLSHLIKGSKETTSPRDTAVAYLSSSGKVGVWKRSGRCVVVSCTSVGGTAPPSLIDPRTHEMMMPMVMTRQNATRIKCSPPAMVLRAG